MKQRPDAMKAPSFDLHPYKHAASDGCRQLVCVPKFYVALADERLSNFFSIARSISIEFTAISIIHAFN